MLSKFGAVKVLFNYYICRPRIKTSSYTSWSMCLTLPEQWNHVECTDKPGLSDPWETWYIAIYDKVLIHQFRFYVSVLSKLDIGQTS